MRRWRCCQTIVLAGALLGCGRIGFDTGDAAVGGGPDGSAPSNVVGEPDPGFGDGGVRTYDYIDDDGTSKDDRATAVAIDSQGRIIASASGTYAYYVNGDQLDMAAITIRLTPDGAFDGTYQSGAQSTPGVTIERTGRYSHGTDLVLDASDDPVMLGYREWGGTDDPTLFRYLAAGGQPDPSFGADGQVAITMSGEVQGTALAVDPTDGNYVVVGGTSGTAMIIAKVRRDTGAPIATFAADGTLVYDGPGSDSAADVVVDGSGRSFVVGTTMGATSDLTVWCYLPDGTLDAGFAGGIVRYDGGDADTGEAIALAPDGGLIVVGATTVAGQRYPVTLRLDAATGLRDPAFGDAGRVIAAEPGAAYGMVIDTNGAIFVTGTIDTGAATGAMAVWQLTPLGTPSADFGTGGTFTTELGAGGGRGVGWDLTLDRSGRLVVAGESLAPSGFYDAAIWRIE